MSITTKKNGNEWEVLLSGNINYSDKDSFKDLINCFSVDGVKKLILDFHNVKEIESSSLGSLLILRDESEKYESDIIIKNLNGKVKTIFQKSLLCELFTIE